MASPNAIRYRVAGLVLCAAFALAGCKTDEKGAPTSALPAGAGTIIGGVAAQVESVKDATSTACKFIPTAETVLGLANALGFGGSAGAVTVAVLKSQIVAEICAAVTTKKAGRGSGPLKARGVLIRGRFVR